MLRQQTLIKEIRTRLDELESLLNPATPPTPTVAEPQNFQFSDSILRMNETVFKITPVQRIELCEFISTTHDNKINVKRFIEKIDPSRCRCYCLVKEIDRRKQFLTERENLYYDETKNKYYSQCRMPSIPNNNNYCNRHTNAQEIDISRMKILTNDTYNLTIDSTIKSYCMSHLPNETQVAPQTQQVPIKEQVAPQKKPVPVETKVAPQTQQVPIKEQVAPQKKLAPAKKEPVEPQKKLAPAKKDPVATSKKSLPIKKSPVEVPKVKENSDIESISNSENESSSSSDSEVDMIVSKVSESLKAPVSEEESGSEAEDSDDCMLDADEIHDEEGNTYYIDEAKSVIKLDEEGYGERLGMLKEFKSGNLFYKNKRWKIEYFPKK
jgi:hypothetical protein